MRKNTILLVLLTIALILTFGRSEAAPNLNDPPPLNKKIIDNPIFLPLVLNKHLNCASAPMLLSPPNGSHLDTLIPALTWARGDSPFISHTSLEVAEDPEFRQNVFGISFMSGILVVNTYQMEENLEPNTLYYWRTQTRCDDGRIHGPFSETWTFTTGSSGIIPEPPILLSPSNGETVDSLPVTLKWQPVSGATGYLATWQNIDEYWWGYMWVNEPSITLRYLDTNATYKWSIRARTEYAISDDSEEWQFTTPPETNSSMLLDDNTVNVYSGDTQISIQNKK